MTVKGRVAVRRRRNRRIKAKRQRKNAREVQARTDPHPEQIERINQLAEAVQMQHQDATAVTKIAENARTDVNDIAPETDQHTSSATTIERAMNENCQMNVDKGLASESNYKRKKTLVQVNESISIFYWLEGLTFSKCIIMSYSGFAKYITNSSKSFRVLFGSKRKENRREL